VRMFPFDQFAVPLPYKGTDWGLLFALSVRVMEDIRDPVAFGVKVTAIVHSEFAATLLPHVFVWEKSAG